MRRLPQTPEEHQEELQREADAFAARVAENWPPFTPEQVALLTALLRSAVASKAKEES